MFDGADHAAWDRTMDALPTETEDGCVSCVVHWTITAAMLEQQDRITEVREGELREPRLSYDENDNQFVCKVFQPVASISSANVKAKSCL